MKRKGFFLIDIILGLGLLGLLALVVQTSIITTSKTIVSVENRAELIDNCQRVVESLKVPSEENNDLFLEIMSEDGFVDYACSFLAEDMVAMVKLDYHDEKLQMYTVTVRGEGSDVSLSATRVIQ
ncbi:MAG: hypothetical protein NUK57_10515 [Gudongella sp.]|nr:hypothetical protein [Gudongella sp.]